MHDRTVTVDAVELCLETFGEPTDPAVVLIGGAGCSMDLWDGGLCRRLADQGRFVIRYDHRDTGRSTASPAGAPTYTSDDLATDPLRVLDALDVEAAHLVGLSMGGGIAQRLAAQHPDRVATITLIATSPAGGRTGDATLSPPAPRAVAAFEAPADEPDWDDRAAVVAHLLEGERPFAGSEGFDDARVRALLTSMVERTTDVRAAATNHLAVADGPSEPFHLADIDVPTLVLHGTDDPMFPIDHGEALAAEIPGARLLRLDGAGHEVPPPRLWDVVVPAIVEHTAG